MSPKKYMEIIAKFFGVSYDDAMKSTLIDWDKVDRFAKQMKEHKKFELGFLKYLRGGGSQEGRHRALAAMSLGCKQIPVVVIENVEYDEKVELANKYKDLSKEELNDKLRMIKTKKSDCNTRNKVSNFSWSVITRKLLNDIRELNA